ncbi:MAG: ATP-binding protein [Pseudomonadota bacterium]|nr:ATP-binding protein [Pseudomonadota bacterium]
MYRNRQIYPALERQKNNGKITILIGPRQVGKTTLLRRLYNQFNSDHHCLFLDLDIYSHYEQVSSYENLINTLKLSGYQALQQKLFILFLDEFQRYSDISRALKSVCDHHPNIKIYASGSSSLAINEQIHESLAGRKRILRIYPLSFQEYLHFCGRDDINEKLQKVSIIQCNNLDALLPDAFEEFYRFLIYGGYPEVAQVDEREKREVLASIFDLYVKKDLVDFLKIDRIKHAKTLIRHLAVNHGRETSYSRLAQVATIDEKTAKNYVEILMETFVVTVHSPWFMNRNKELVKTPKIYFLDNGLRNFFINNFNPHDMRQDSSFLFEGYVISELIKSGVMPDQIKFWRTKNRQEVDLILDDGGELKPVEIKYKKCLKSTDYRGLKAYRKAYPNCNYLYLVNLTNNSMTGEVQHLSPFDLDQLKPGT